MNIENNIPSPYGFIIDEDSALTEDFQKLFKWFELVQDFIKKSSLEKFSGVALHFLKDKKLGGEFFDDLTYVKTIEGEQDLWVESPPKGILLTFACGFATSEQKNAGEPWPDFYKEGYPPLWIVEFVIFDDKAWASSFLAWSHSLKGSLLKDELFFKKECDWEEMMNFINAKLQVLKKC